MEVEPGDCLRGGLVDRQCLDSDGVDGELVMVGPVARRWARAAVADCAEIVDHLLGAVG